MRNWYCSTFQHICGNSAYSTAKRNVRSVSSPAKSLLCCQDGRTGAKAWTGPTKQKILCQDFLDGAWRGVHDGNSVARRRGVIPCLVASGAYGRLNVRPVAEKSYDNLMTPSGSVSRKFDGCLSCEGPSSRATTAPAAAVFGVLRETLGHLRYRDIPILRVREQCWQQSRP